MSNKSELGKYLSELLNILNISGSRLARAINVDPSVISRWRTGKRMISSNSNYLEIISSYLADNITTTIQKDKIRNMTVKFNIQVDIGNSINMNEYIFNILSASQQDCKVNNQNRSTEKNQYTDNDSAYCSNENIQITANEKNTVIIGNDSKQNISCKSSYMAQNILNNYNCLNCFQVITDHKKIIETKIELLKSALYRPCCRNESILMTCFTEFDSFYDYETPILEYREYKKTLLEMMKKGWNIKKFIILNENKNRNYKIINEMKMFLMTGRYHPYYIKKYVPLLCAIDFIIVPTIGALLCLGSQNSYKIDSAFLIKDQESIEIFKGLFNQFLQKSQPLINEYSTETIDFQQAITECEEKLGNRFLYKDGLSNVTIPADIYSTYLYRTKTSDFEISKKISNHKRRLKSFISQINNYKYYDICSKKSIEELVKKCIHSNYDYNSHKVFTPNPIEVLKHLDNVVYLLERYDNYRLALLDDNKISNHCDALCIIKDSHSVFIQNDNLHKNDLLKSHSCTEQHNNKINISISEPTIVNTFKDHFFDLWDEIAPINRDKESVISWLKVQMKSIRKT